MNEQKGFLYQAKFSLNKDYFECMTFMPDPETRYKETEFYALSDRDAVIEAQKYKEKLEKDKNYFNPRARIMNIVRFWANKEGQIQKIEIKWNDFLKAVKAGKSPNYQAVYKIKLDDSQNGFFIERDDFYASNDANAYAWATDTSDIEENYALRKIRPKSITLERLLRIEEISLK